jgi:hypothetical protein
MYSNKSCQSSRLWGRKVQSLLRDSQNHIWVPNEECFLPFLQNQEDFHCPEADKNSGLILTRTLELTGSMPTSSKPVPDHLDCTSICSWYQRREIFLISRDGRSLKYLSNGSIIVSSRSMPRQPIYIEFIRLFSTKPLPWVRDTLRTPLLPCLTLRCPHNMILTKGWMVVLPRRRAAVNKEAGVNALGMLGYIAVATDNEILNWVSAGFDRLPSGTWSPKQ